MYHSVTFGDKNTWDDWHIVPSSRPVFNPPEPKTKTIDVNGADGYIDMTDKPAGYPTFNNRQGSFEFYVMNEDDNGDSYGAWYDRYTKIMAYLHGRKMKAYLEDDSLYYYEGRFKVNEWKSDKDYSKIVIDYDVEPYKRSVVTSLEDWLWDPFVFKRDSVPQETEFKNIKVSSKSNYVSKVYSVKQYGTAPICPTIITDRKIKMRYSNQNISPAIYQNGIILEKGSHFLPRCVMYGGNVTFDFKLDSSESKAATVSVEFREGQL